MSSRAAPRLISNVSRSRALTPITSAPRATARSRSSSKTASAPARRSSASWAAVEKKPFASSGRLLADLAAARSATEPSKRSSTRIDTAAAPAAANPAARSAGSASGRRSPAEGERRFTSAIAPRPDPRSASRKRAKLGGPLFALREHDQLVEPRRRRARVDRLLRELEPLAQVVCVPACCDRAGGVEQDRAAPAAVLAREDGADRGGVVVG